MLLTKSNRKIQDIVTIGSLVFLYIISSTIYLDRFPKVWVDEAWDSTSAYTFQLDGTIRNPALPGDINGNQDVHFLQPRIVPIIVEALFFKLFGIGSIQGELASILMGAITVCGIYFLARKVGSPLFGFLCSLLFIVDNLFFVAARTIRPEIYVVAFVIWSIILLLDSGNNFWKLFFVGVVLGVSLYVHPNSILIIFSIFLIALSRGQKKDYGRILGAIILGIAFGFLPYVLYIWNQDGGNNFRDFWVQIQNRADPVINTPSFIYTTWVSEFQRYSSYIFFPYRLPIFLI